MSMRRIPLVCVLLMPGSLVQAGDADTGFSEPATAEDIARVYWATFPNGDNLPEGSGTVTQGKPLYETHCTSCHGVEGQGSLARQLVGGRGTLDSDAPIKTIGSYWPYATTIFNFTRRAMPYTAPMSLSNDDYYAITAYLLNKNDIIADDAVMDKDTLPAVRMPNRDGFVNAYPDTPKEYDYMQ